MPDESEIETRDLQEALDEMHEERAEREAEAKKTGWTKYIGLTTAILAVFAAVGSLQAGSLVNKSVIDQLLSSDSWNEYQASKEKGHLYTIAADNLLDSASAPANVAEVSPKTGQRHSKGWAAKPEETRLKEYEDEADKETDKQVKLSKKGKDLSELSQREFEHHEKFAQSVTLIQVAIALGGISALAKIKSVWFLSIASGLIGILYFAMGFSRG